MITLSVFQNLSRAGADALCLDSSDGFSVWQEKALKWIKANSIQISQLVQETLLILKALTIWLNAAPTLLRLVSAEALSA